MLHDYLPARSTDPETSHLAAEHIIATGKRAHQQHQALAAVRAFPDHTSLEIAEAARCCRFQLARRLPELERDGLVERGPARTCRVSGRKAATWRAVSQQLEMA